MSTLPFLLHPIIFYFVQNALTISTIAFTSPSSTIRFAILPLSLLCIYTIFPTYLDRLPRGVVASVVSGTTFANILQYIGLVVLTRLSCKQQGLYQRLQYGYFINSASRLIGTPLQVKNVPFYSTSDRAHIPSRTSFLLRKALIFSICYIVLDLATSSAKPAENHIHYSLNKIPCFTRWGDVTSEEIIRKLVGGIAYWTASYCTMQCYMGAWAFISVACGSDPKYWRPNFGPLSEGYTIRRFWGYVYATIGIYNFCLTFSSLCPQNILAPTSPPPVNFFVNLRDRFPSPLTEAYPPRPLYTPFSGLPPFGYPAHVYRSRCSRRWKSFL